MDAKISVADLEHVSLSIQKQKHTRTLKFPLEINYII